MKESALAEKHPWTLAWWKVEGENAWVFVYLIVIHVLAAVGLVLYPLPGWKVFLATLALAALGGMGTTVCYHRCLSHRAAKLNPVVEQILIFFAVFNASGTPLTWVANHRNHHANADTIDDVSSPRLGGFWWAHLRWLYQWPASSVSRWCPDLNLSRYRVWSTVQIPIVLVSLTIGYLFLGWAGFFWMGALRLVYCLHGQCFVNSLLHLKSGLPVGVDSSQNIWWLGPLQFTAWGENWHFNHHDDPSSASFSRAWWQTDIGWYTIRTLEVLGLAYDVRGPRRARRAA